MNVPPNASDQPARTLDTPFENSRLACSDQAYCYALHVLFYQDQISYVRMGLALIYQMRTSRKLAGGDRRWSPFQSLILIFPATL